MDKKQLNKVKLITYAILFLKTFFLNSQVQLNFKVSDPNDRPVQFVIGKNADQTYESDKDGNIKIRNYILGSKVFLSNINFIDTSIIVKEPLSFNDSAILVIKLRPKVIVIDEIPVFTSGVEEVNPIKADFIIDYELSNGNLLELLTNAVLVIQDNNIKSKLRSFPQANNLVKDPFGNINIVADNGVYKIINDKSSFQIDSAIISLNKFNEAVRSCDEVIDTTFFLHRYKDINQTMEFIAAWGKTSKLLKTISTKNKDFVRKNARRLISNSMQIALASYYAENLGGIMGDIDTAELRKRRHLERDIMTHKMLYAQPSYNVLKAINDSIYLFAHDIDSLLIYDKQGTFIRSKYIDYHHLKFWDKEIIVNEEKTKVYAKLKTFSSTMLAEINLYNGQLKFPFFKIESNTSPKKIKVIGNTVYFMGKQQDGVGNSVYSQSLQNDPVFLKPLPDTLSQYRKKIFSFNETTEKEIEWEHPPVRYDSIAIPDQFKSNGVVIIDEKVNFRFTEFSKKEIRKNVLLKITNEEGLKAFHSVSLPESFDIGENEELRQQGRQSKIKIPFIKTFSVKYFIARIIKPNGKVIEAHPKYSSTRIKWIKPTGQEITVDAGKYIEDIVNNYSFTELEVGDLVEYSYNAEYGPNYGSDIFYFSSTYPKVNVEYKFRYIALPQLKNFKFIMTSNISDSCVKVVPDENSSEKGIAFVNASVKLKNVQRVNYFIHSFCAKQLPFVYFNMNYTIKLINNKSYSIANLPDYRWANTQGYRYDNRFHVKYFDDVRKFVSKMPKFDSDTNNLKFLKAVSDTLNNFRYMGANYLYYNDPAFYNLYSSEHVLKRRITEINLTKLYESILTEKGIFFYITNILDNRLGEQNPLVRINTSYENIIISIPIKKSYTYLIPRYNGLKYFLGEMPFYYEGAIAAMFPSSYEKKAKDVLGTHFKFVRTPSGTENKNVRFEDVKINVETDSLKCNLEIKETLSGQFSTIIRSAYLNEVIDSTVNPVYFKKCINKPNSSHQKINLKTKSEEDPFKFVFDCHENILLKNKNEIDLTNWFSFVLNKFIIYEKPTHDFYFDFRFSDYYNYLFEFDRPVNISNIKDFNKELGDEYFEISSSLKPQENSYLFSVIIKIKQKFIPKEEGDKLMEFVNKLEEINNLKIKYSLLE